MHALGRAETVKTRLAMEVCHRRPWRAWLAHDAPAGPSSSPGRFLVVTSNHEHPHGLRTWGRRLEKEENDGGELDTVDRDGGDALANSKQKQASNTPLPPRDWLKQGVEEVEGSKAELWMRFGGLRCDGELTRPRGSARRRGWLGSSALVRTEGRRRRKWMERRAMDGVAT
jgi:hypothetical protein